jgi:hypothetical protein
MIELLLKPPGGAAWTPPQSASLIGAWVSALSGNVAKLGTWASQYGVTRNATMISDAQVTGNGLLLETNGDYVTAGTSSAANARGLWSIAMWSNRTGLPFGFGFPVVGWVANDGTWGGLLMDTSGMIFAVRTGSPNNIAIETPSTGAWRHYAATYDGTSLRGYLNGSPVGSPLTSTGSLSMANAPVVLGMRAIDYWNGKLDCIYLYGGLALSAAEVADIAANDPNKRA